MGIFVETIAEIAFAICPAARSTLSGVDDTPIASRAASCRAVRSAGSEAAQSASPGLAVRSTMSKSVARSGFCGPALVVAQTLPDDESRRRQKVA
jgi:hypothetical protein